MKRHRTVIAALFAVLACMCWAGESRAAPFTPELEADYQIALTEWGVTAPPKCETVDAELVPAGSLDEGIAGRASMPGEYIEAICALRIVEGLSACQIRGVMVHEVGHLLGHGHSLDPNNVMFGQATSYFCRAEVATLAEAEATAKVTRCRIKKKGTTGRRMCWEGARIFRANARERWAEVPPLAF